MLSLEQFVEDAIKTESKIDSVKVNETLLSETISILISAGNILDQIKKNIFYEKTYDIDALMLQVNKLNQSISSLNSIDTNDIVDKKSTLSINPRIFHSIIGISTEATELLEALDPAGNNMDNINIAEEFSDIDWYKAIGCNELDIKWVTILDAVIAKLKARYPNSFTSEDAINRDLNKEREILDTMENQIEN